MRDGPSRAFGGRRQPDCASNRGRARADGPQVATSAAHSGSRRMAPVCRRAEGDGVGRQARPAYPPAIAATQSLAVAGRSRRPRPWAPRCCAAPVAVEVGCSHRTVLERDLAEQRRRQAVAGPALHLGARSGLGEMAVPQSMAVTTRPTLGSPFSSFTSATWATTEPKLSCTATPRVQPAGARRGPAGLLGGEVQHRQVPVRAGLRVERAAVVDRVLAGPLRQLVDGVLHDEGGVGRAHRAPPQHRHAGVRA